MCGIAGILSTPSAAERGLALAAGGTTSVGDALSRMVEWLRHRGPDDQGATIISADASVIALGHTRLAILDLSEAGHQPMRDAATANWITYNGEIYNYREVRQRVAFEAAEWHSETDTEVILKAYAKWGRDCLSHLRGMFAFALWDAERQELFLARDRLGIKPLYYYRGEDFFLFGSEVRALLGSGLIARRVDAVALWEYMAYQTVPAPRTLIEDVRVLSPGSWMTVDASGRICQGQYWHPLEHASSEAQGATADENRRRVGELLREAVALHLVSDVPVGAFLSGGIDSSALVALMHEAGQRPRTFSVVFSEDRFDETRYARQIAERFRTEHTEIQLTEQALLDQLLDALAVMDEPTGDGINTYVVSRVVRSTGMKVALSGLGGDEFFAGYPSFARLERAANYLLLWGSVPSFVRSLAARTIKSLGGSSVATTKTAAVIESDGTLAAVFPLMRQLLSASQRRALLMETWLRQVDEAPDPYVQLLQEAFANASGTGRLAQISYAEGRTYMHDVLLRDTDQMSMAHALEVRVPLLDHKLVEYVIGIPDEQKRANGTPKRLLVESLGGLLPRSIVHRPKQGFTLPFDPWMRGALREFCEERLSPERTESRGLLRPEQVQKLWRAFLDGSPAVTWSRVWILVVLEEWLERNGVKA